MQLSLFKAAALAVAIQTTVAKPVHSGRQTVATTTTSDGQTLDWVIPESQVQGKKLSTPPPSPPTKRSHLEIRSQLQARVDSDPGRQGPKGTVPVLRSGNSTTTATKRLPTTKDHAISPKVKTTASNNNFGQHWYASSGQQVSNFGGKATFSLYDSFLENESDFSLLQTAIIRSTTPEQTVEAGWINYPSQSSQPHFFSFYTTNGYVRNGDNIGGWNTDTAGWVQVDAQLYPGIAFLPFSTSGGAQFDIDIGYYLYEGDWWLWCTDRYIGYYPGTLFSDAPTDSGESLADGSDLIDFYGEIYNGEAAMTTTDMGSGEFPTAGFGKSAYIRNIVYYNPDGSAVNYNGSDQIIISDKTRYDLVAEWDSPTTWGSYFYLGGPGAGGKVGA